MERRSDRRPRSLAVAAGVAIAAAVILGLVGWGAAGDATPPPQSGGAEPRTLQPRPTGSSAGSPTPASGGGRDGRAVPLAELADSEWVARVSTATGIPPRALAAYAGAAIQIEGAYPGCGIGWNTLAAIGLVESDHGSFGVSQLRADGRVVPAIVGIALDGTQSAVVSDTDDGLLDGDTRWDRAVGPLQFIPSTWAHYRRDGDLDGATDPQQIDDAALAAAAYLCDIGGDLTQSAGWIAAVSAYNDAVGYNTDVAETADRYAAAG